MARVRYTMAMKLTAVLLFAVLLELRRRSRSTRSSLDKKVIKPLVRPTL